MREDEFNITNDEDIYEKGYTDKIQKFLFLLSKEAKNNNLICHNYRDKFINLHNKLSTISIISSAITTMMIGTNGIVNLQNMSTPILILTVTSLLFSVTSNISQGLKAHFQYFERGLNLNQIGNLYNELQKYILEHLMLPLENRTNAVNLIENIRIKFVNYAQRAFPVPVNFGNAVVIDDNNYYLINDDDDDNESTI